ncbi:MAG: NADH:ubiquinone reductase (Na(+)-transporting) subunit C [Muribaculaceae bacterium]|nr:NADH:ubiquinone reductase (Na(+)-transporting) subunit C [Muribaculaceae bacterium]
MNRHGNIYTIIYIVVLVTVVGATLAFTSISLKDKQRVNADADKMRQILASVNIISEKKDILNDYEKYIIDSYIIDNTGKRLDIEVKAFDVNVAKQSKELQDKRLLPIYECRLDDGSLKYIVPMYGAGLWGPIWGYISVDADGSTIYGAYFAHQSETPGLGAEIENEYFGSRFIGKRIIKNHTFTPVAVVKNGKKPMGNQEYVDGISGATITSKGVSSMIENCLTPYAGFLESLSVE